MTRLGHEPRWRHDRQTRRAGITLSGAAAVFLLGAVDGDVVHPHSFGQASNHRQADAVNPPMAVNPLAPGLPASSGPLALRSR